MHPVHEGVGTEVPGNIPLWCLASVLVLRGAKCCRGRRMPVGHAVFEVGLQWRPASAPLRCVWMQGPWGVAGLVCGLLHCFRSHPGLQCVLRCRAVPSLSSVGGPGERVCGGGGFGWRFRLGRWRLGPVASLRGLPRVWHSRRLASLTSSLACLRVSPTTKKTSSQQQQQQQQQQMNSSSRK